MNTKFRYFVVMAYVAMFTAGCSAIPSAPAPVDSVTVSPISETVEVEAQSIPAATTQPVVAREIVTPSKQCNASAYLPMAPRDVIQNPSELADRMEVSLRDDPTGTSRIRGTNAAPEHYLRAVQAAGGEVDGVGALPEYLRSLVSNPMPEGQIRMSRIVYTKKGSNGTCVERYALDVTEGYSRSAMEDEQGWYDANTGRLILAENCTNSPIHPLVEASTLSATRTDYKEVPLTCVPIETEHDWNVVFPYTADFEAWRRCNPTARCSLDCERWLAEGDRFVGGKGDYYSSRVRRVTGQKRSNTYALKGVTHRPTHMTGRSVMCKQGSDHYWVWLKSGEPRYIEKEEWRMYFPKE